MTPTNYAAFITTVDTALGSLYLELDLAVTYERYTKIDPMTGGSIKAYGWTGMTPKPRPWFGQRVPYEPAPQTYQVEVIPHELTLQMDKFILMDSDPNAMSIFWTNLPKMARQWRRFPEYEGRDLVEARALRGDVVGEIGAVELVQAPQLHVEDPVGLLLVDLDRRARPVRDDGQQRHQLGPRVVVVGVAN